MIGHLRKRIRLLVTNLIMDKPNTSIVDSLTPRFNSGAHPLPQLHHVNSIIRRICTIPCRPPVQRLVIWRGTLPTLPQLHHVNFVIRRLCTISCVPSVQWQSLNHLPGHSVVPKFLCWMRKPIGKGNPDAIRDARMAETVVENCKSKCGYCHKYAEEFTERFWSSVQDAKVHGIVHECEVRAWSKGHKAECVSYP